jgi:hypothetical protein
MQFLFPTFLWALLGLSIPIIIHLFYFRRFKKVYFTNVKYLREIKEETSNRNKLKNLLVLLSRCLAVAALVFAFAQPFLPKGSGVKSGKNQVSVFVDNSFSMMAAKGDIPLLDIAKEKARYIIQSYGEEDQFQVLTHDFEGRHQRLLSKEDAMSYVNEIKVSPAVKKLDVILNRQRQLLERTNGNKISYVISDFQRSITNLENYLDTLLEVNLVPVHALKQKNIAVDSVWFEGPIPFINQTNNLIVRVKNNSPDDAEQVKISFVKDGQEKPVAIKNIPANQSTTDTVHMTIDKTGWQQGVVKVMDYPLQFDDQFFISFLVPDTIKALFINDSGSDKYMNALFNGVKHFSLVNQNANQLQYQQFSTFDLIILHDLKSITTGLGAELAQYMRNGGKVLVFPGKNADINSYNTFLAIAGGIRFSGQNVVKREVSSINMEEFIFSDVFVQTGKNLKLPSTSFSFDLMSVNSIGEEKIMSYRDGGTYMGKYRIGDGRLFICAAPLSTEVNDLVHHAEVFVPLIYKMAISSSKQKPLSYTINNKVTIAVENKRKTGEYVYKVVKDKWEIIPGQVPAGATMVLDMSDQVREAGFYDLKLKEEVVGKLAFNYDRNESDMSLYSESDLESMHPSNSKVKVITEALQANISGTISEKDKGIVLWKWFVIMALIFLAIESLLLRFYKN